MAIGIHREGGSGRGLHSITYPLNMSAFCEIGGASSGCLGGVEEVAGFTRGGLGGIICVRNGSG